ncbi:anaerobic dehydrogenases, typically selenocysteine-containing [Calderihabitans maritimus]|nr:anaerobic dehydrogenases, typically selenocysteine-containing [Calderihabitans maritimus]
MTNHWIDYKNSDAFLVIGANPAENHPLAMKWINKARETRGAKLIVVDPRFSKTAAQADIYVRHRPGSDIAFINGLMNYAIQNNLYHHEYVVNYTNASFLVNPEYGFHDGLFSGFVDGKYDRNSWQYQKDGDEIKKDPTLQDPNCVFQLLKKHVSRYDIKTVSEITGVPEKVYQEVCETFCATGRPGKAGNVIYAMGITQHTHGAQNVRALAILQLLLGNIGIPGGGVNAQRGESNVQGSTDLAMLYHLLPGYLGMPRANKHANLQEYIEKETPKSGYWSNKPKFLISMLKAWYGEKATKENDFCFDYLPKLTAGEHSHMAIFQDMMRGKIKGMFAWGQNPAVGGPNASMERKALEKLDWLVVIDLFETETAAFWKAPGVDPRKIDTEVFLLPAAASYEKEGSITNSGRWIQWRYQAINPPGDAKSDLWIADRLFKAVREQYRKDKSAVFPEPILNMVWNYDKPGQEEPDVEQVAIELNGYDVATGKPLNSFGKLKDDGSTACGMWIYTGYYADREKPACKNRNPEKDGLGSNLGWAFAWPLNRRILYNRCATDPKGKPWNPKLPLFAWNGVDWVKNDVPDFNAKVSPEVSAANPFIMLPEGHGRLFTQGLKDGPIPEHYEPVESPVKNKMSSRQFNPCITFYGPELGELAEVGSDEYPYIATTHRLIEHYQSGAMTRNCPYLVELMPEMFVEISPNLARKLGIRNGDEVEVISKRGKIRAKACVTPIMRAVKVNGKECEVVGLPWHWGYQGLAPGSTANDLTPCVGDPNTAIPEYKAFLCNIKKV